MNIKAYWLTYEFAKRGAMTMIHNKVIFTKKGEKFYHKFY